MDSIKELFTDRTHYKIVLNILKNFKDNLKVLEVGSLDECIRKMIPVNLKYSSLDVVGNPDYKIDLNHKKIPVKDNTFDILICLETLEHTLYPQKIIDELKRVTKKQGTFILSLPNDYNFWQRINFLLGRRMQGTDEAFEVVTKAQHIHKLRAEDILFFFSKNFGIKKMIPIWQSRSSGKNSFFEIFDKFLNFLAKIYPPLFARLILVVCKNK